MCFNEFSFLVEMEKNGREFVLMVDDVLYDFHPSLSSRMGGFYK
jgi:hypothetical protein